MVLALHYTLLAFLKSPTRHQTRANFLRTGLMLWFGKRHQNRQEVLSIVIRFVLGVGLVLVILTGYNKTVFGNLLVSTWLIPIVVLVYTIGT